MRLIPIIGNRYERLIVVNVVTDRKTKSNHLLYNCKCDCGNMIVTTSSALKSGNTGSCGCLHRDRTSAAKKKAHSTKSSEYRSWYNMKSRCSNRNNDRYSAYGGRGIKVCSRWESYENFYADMGAKPSISHSIERIDVNKGYSPDNCKWATTEEQNLNKRTNIYFEICGVKVHLREFLYITGVSMERFKYHFNEKKESLNQILNTFYYGKC